jgi:uncharacterized DUF497 family protein
MRINRIIWYHRFVEKLWDTHRVEVHEAEEALQNHGRVRRVKRGHAAGEDVYLALGQTDAGRYLSVFFVYKQSHDALVISARDMDVGERREYGKT